MKTKGKKKSNKAVFLDRDGVINIYKPYLYRRSDFKFTPFALRAVKKISRAGYKIIVVTNQSGIARKYYRHKDVRFLHNWLLSEFKKRNVNIDAIYYCPHHPEDNCNCRKPRLGMAEFADADFNIDFKKSWMIGDDMNDIYFGKKARMKTILVKNKFLAQDRKVPDFFVKNLNAAAEVISSESGFL